MIGWTEFPLNRQTVGVLIVKVTVRPEEAEAVSCWLVSFTFILPG